MPDDEYGVMVQVSTASGGARSWDVPESQKTVNRFDIYLFNAAGAATPNYSRIYVTVKDVQ
jgi:hypothetical protein